MTVTILEGDCREVLRTLPSESVHCIVTSPPYFGLRDYGVDGQIGLEQTPDEYVSEMVGVFREARRVLRDDGTLWLNLGDSYTGSGKGGNPEGSPYKGFVGNTAREAAATAHAGKDRLYGLQAKNLIGIPWRVAFALQADGWYLRQDIIWHKPNPMPESVTDRCTKAHEYVFLLAKSARYWYDAEAVAEPVSVNPVTRARNGRADQGIVGAGALHGTVWGQSGNGGWDRSEVDARNRRSVWSIATQPYAEAHFATMAPELARTCILAGCPEGGMVLDPFGGAGTTGLVADQLGRNAVLIELNPTYADLARNRIKADAGMFGAVA